VRSPGLPARPRRWLWATVALGLCGLLVGGAVYGINRWSGPRTPTLGPIGGPDQVTLITADGDTPFGRKVLGAQPGIEPVGRKDGGLVVSTNETVLIELVPKELTGRPFEATAEVQYTRQSGNDSAVGIYFAHNPQSPAEGPDHTIAHFTYHEQSAATPGLRRQVGAGPREAVAGYEVGLNHLVNPKVGRLSTGAIRSEARRDFPTPRISDQDAYPGRTIRLRVTAQRVSGWFDDHSPVTIDHALLTDSWNRLPGLIPRPPFDPTGGVGLYVKQATVVFRNLRIGPPTD
jgi:hypothetical protein